MQLTKTSEQNPRRQRASRKILLAGQGRGARVASAPRSAGSSLLKRPRSPFCWAWGRGGVGELELGSGGGSSSMSLSRKKNIKTSPASRDRKDAGESPKAFDQLEKSPVNSISLEGDIQ